jgi:hypothetical protein
VVWQEINGTPVGSPIFGILAEIFLQEIENKYYPNIIKKKDILFIARYVDDILIIFDAANTTAGSILKIKMSCIRKLKYKMKTESNQQISSSDLNICRGANEFILDMYRKPT